MGKRMPTDVQPGDFILHFRSEGRHENSPPRRMAALLKHALRVSGFRLVQLRGDVPELPSAPPIEPSRRMPPGDNEAAPDGKIQTGFNTESEPC
jgi:hypothetical protein